MIIQPLEYNQMINHGIKTLMFCILNLQLVLDSVLEAHGLITNIQTWVNLKTSSPLFNLSTTINSQTWSPTNFSSLVRATVESTFHIFHGKFINTINLLMMELKLAGLDITLKDLWLEMELPTGTSMSHQVSHLLPITSTLSQRKPTMTTTNSAARFSSTISNQDSDPTKLNAANFGIKTPLEACAN